MQGGANGELMFNGFRGFVWEDENVLETEDGDGHQTMRMYLMPQIVYLQNG